MVYWNYVIVYVCVSTTYGRQEYKIEYYFFGPEERLCVLFTIHLLLLYFASLFSTQHWTILKNYRSICVYVWFSTLFLYKYIYLCSHDIKYFQYLFNFRKNYENLGKILDFQKETSKLLRKFRRGNCDKCHTYDTNTYKHLLGK